MPNKSIPIKILLPFLIVLCAIAFMADSCNTSQTDASNTNANTAAQKWGSSPNITNFYEYSQLKEIYELRDNPNLIMNAYLQGMDGSLRCLGRVKGFGVPYGTQWSPPANATQGAIPEPNGLYPSSSTSADWVELVGPDGKTHMTFVEPNLIITDLTLPCKVLDA